MATVEWAHATAQAFALWTRVRGSGLRGGRAAFVDGEMGVCIHGVAPAGRFIYTHYTVLMKSYLVLSKGKAIQRASGSWLQQLTRCEACRVPAVSVGACICIPCVRL